MTRGRRIAIALAIAAFPTAGFAQDPGVGFSASRRTVVTLDGIGGVVHQRIKYEGADGAVGATHAGLFSSFMPPAYPLPRLGLHHFVSGPISLGLELHYSDNDMFGTTFVAAPRLGIAFGISESFAWWLRGGLAYVSQKMELFSDITFTDLRPGVQLDAVLAVTDHFAATLGAKGEIGVLGKQEIEIPGDYYYGGGGTQERDFAFFEAGLVVGALVDF